MSRSKVLKLEAEAQTQTIPRIMPLRKGYAGCLKCIRLARKWLSGLATFC